MAQLYMLYIDGGTYRRQYIGGGIYWSICRDRRFEGIDQLEFWAQRKCSLQHSTCSEAEWMALIETLERLVSSPVGNAVTLVEQGWDIKVKWVPRDQNVQRLGH